MTAPILRPSDAVNLSSERVPCPVCAPETVMRAWEHAGVLAEPSEYADLSCDRCKGKGTLAADTGRKRISHSMLKDFLACPRRYQLDRLERLEPIARRDYLEMGSAFQAAIEHRDPSLGARLLLEGTEVYTQEEEDQLRINACTVQSAAAYYLRRWPANDREQREVEYLVRLRSPYTGAWSQTYDLFGFADGVEEYENHAELVENKLLSRLDVATVRSLALDRQMSLEAYGLWRATGKSVTRIKYRIVKKPSIKPRKGRRTKNGIVGAETIDQFLERLAADYLDPERRDFYGHEEILRRSDDDLLRTEASLWSWARQLRDMDRDAFYPMNSDYCAGFGGCRFAPICTHQEDAHTLYRRRPERIPTPELAPVEAA